MTDPVETPKRLYRKAARGKDESAPLIVLSGVTVAIMLVVGVMTAKLTVSAARADVDKAGPNASPPAVAPRNDRRVTCPTTTSGVGLCFLARYIGIP